MDILHITFSLQNGGKENLLADIANEQSYLGHEVTILIINGEADPEIKTRIGKNVRFIELGRQRKSRNIFVFLRLIALIRLRVRPEIVHSHDSSVGKILRRYARIPCVLTIHGPDVPVSGMNNYDAIFAISKAVKKDVERRGGPSCKVIYNGIDTKAIKRRERIIPTSVFRLIQVKRLNHDRKGQDILMRATEQLVHVYGFDNIEVCFIGEGESEHYLRQLAKTLSIDDHVKFLGGWSRARVYSDLCEFDAFVHPSRYEGFGLTVAEAMAAKVPVVASNIQGPAEILGDGKYGYLFESGDVDSLVGAVASCWSEYNDRTIFTRIEQAYRHSVEQFDIRQTTRRYNEAYPVEV